MNSKIPRILIAAPGSGSGKTSITCGIMKALMKRGKTVHAFKSGPDYIDPMFHTKVIGAKSGNLDLYMLDENTVKYLFAKNSNDADIAVIEGVMGYYDGIGTDASCSASSYHLANVLQSPVVLVIDCKGMATSIAAMIKGFLSFRDNHRIRGVILNRIHPMIFPEVKAMIERELPVEVLGFLPKLEDALLESRHLGLITAQEIGDLEQKLDLLSDYIEQYVNLERLGQIASEAGDFLFDPISVDPIQTDRPLRIGYADDKAFCFYYQDSLQLLSDMGAELIPFSPLADASLPNGLNGMILGGGYPELYAEQLSNNTSLMNEIRSMIEKGLPCIAECGGFMYLHEQMEDEDCNPYQMVGVIDGISSHQGRLVRFGYAEIEAQKDTMICDKGDSIRVHEFHYWDSTNNGDAFIARKPTRNRTWECIVSDHNLIAGYPHMHFYANLRFPVNFLNRCMLYSQNKQS